jgi:xanthine dehydrogenase YagR molybdenum-binding subunit
VSGPVVGTPLPRVEGRRKVTGAARYAAEFNQPNQVYAVMVPSSIGLGRITTIDASAAAQLPGVVAILTHHNAPRLPYGEHRGFVDPAIGERLHVFQDDQVRFFGQPVAVAIATTLDAAEHAAAAVRVCYAAEIPVTRMDAPEALAIVPEAASKGSGRILADSSRGDPAMAQAADAVRVEATYVIAREHHNPMEPHATVAAWDGDHLTLWSKSQFVINEATEIAAIFGLPVSQVLVICPYIGGAFGTSLRTWPHVTVAALAARHVGRPVKLVLSRRQMFYTTGYRPRTVQRVTLAAGADGRLSALLHDVTAETSRYEQHIEAVTTPSTYLYACPNVRTSYRLVPLDGGTPTYMRGPGEASGILALECAMDELAVALGADPIDLRCRNEPALNQHNGLPFSSRSMRECYALGAERFGWAHRDPHPGSMRDGRMLVGWGMSAATYPASRGLANARVRILADGTAEVEAAASDMGPGTYTSMTQVAADTLGLAPADVRFSLGRSDFPATPPHGGSMTMASVGSAVQAACLAARAQAGGTNYRDIIARRGGVSIVAEASSARGDEQRQYAMHAFGAVFVEVVADPDLCTVRVRRAVGAYAAGRIINPQLARSQCIGGMVGGIGMALMEQTIVDARDGRPVNASLADYLVPVNLDVASLDVAFVEESDPHVNPLGVKGLGEIAIVGMAPAIANAVFHATGRRVREFPIRIEALLAT